MLEHKLLENALAKAGAFFVWYWIHIELYFYQHVAKRRKITEKYNDSEDGQLLLFAFTIMNFSIAMACFASAYIYMSMDIKSCRLDINARDFFSLIIDTILHLICFIFYKIPMDRQNIIGTVFFVFLGLVFLLVSRSKFRKLKDYKDIMK